MNSLKTLRDNLPYISACGMAIIGFAMCFPAVAKLVEKRRLVGLGFALLFALLCAAGLLGSYDDQTQKLELQHTIATLSTKIDIENTLNTLTGGDSIPHVSAEIFGSTFSLWLNNNGKYPVYIHHMELAVESDPKSKWPFESRELGAKDKQHLKTFALPENLSRIVIKHGISARNGESSSRVVLVKSGKRWLAAWKGPDNQGIEYVPPRFPRRKDGTVNWGE
jgi:hypothetical protein